MYHKFFGRKIFGFMGNHLVILAEGPTNMEIHSHGPESRNFASIF